MASFAPLRMGRRGVACRMIAILRASDPDVADLLPHGMRPHLVRGHVIATLCYTRLATFRSRWMPAHPGTPTDHLALRIAAERKSVPISAVVRRDTSSWFEARCDKLTRANYRRSHFDVADDRCELSIRVIDRDRQIFAFDGGSRACGTLPRKSLFETPRAAEGFLRSTRRTVPSDTFAPEVDRLPPRDGIALEPMDVTHFEASYLNDLRPDSFELDCALRFVTTRLVTRRQATPEIARSEPTSSFVPAL